MVYIRSLGTESTIPFQLASPTLSRPGVVNRYGVNQAIPLVPTTSDYSDYATGDTPALTALLTATPDADSDVAASAQDVVFSSDIPTVSLIQITALPPTTTSPQAVLPKLPYRRQLNILYLIPLFIALGVVLGAITVAALLKWREKRRRLHRTSTLLPGPPYAASENGVEDRLLAHRYPSMEQVSLFAATPSKFTIHGSRYVPERTLAWQALDATRPPYTQLTHPQTIIPSSDGERFTVVTQEDPFLVTSPITIQQSPKPSNGLSLPEIRNSPSLPSPASGDKSGHHTAQATNLPKPFRRSMFDILKLKSTYRTVLNTHEEYTALPPDDGSADKSPTNRVRRVSSLKTTKVTGPISKNQSRSARRSLDGGCYFVDMEDALGLFGSQDDEQDLADAPIVSPEHRLKGGVLSSPSQGGKMQRPRKVTPFSSGLKGSPEEGKHDEDQSSASRGYSIEEKHPDIHTKAPQRFSPTPHKGLPIPSRRSSAPDAHASVLPLGPPSLMSPPLEKSLFFTSSLSSGMSLASRMDTIATISSSPPHHVDIDRSPDLFPLPSKKRKAAKKLRASWPEPPLPYPPYPDHLDAQRAPRRRSTSSSTRRRPVSSISPKPKGRFTSAAHRESTTGIYSLGSLSPTSLAVALASSPSSDMLNKVNDIVAQGYTKKRTSVGRGEEVAASLPDSI